MRQDFVVIDNFLDEPDKVRQSVLDIGDQLDWDEGHYSGVRASVSDKSYQKMIVDKIESILPFKIEMDIENTSTYSFQIALEPDSTFG